MDRSALGLHKKAPKHLAEMPAFKPAKKGRLQAPYDRFKSKRLQITDLVSVGESYRVVFFWRTGDILSDTAFYAHLLLAKPDGKLHPLFEFHWHPSHKGFHCVTPCRSTVDYTGRMLPGTAGELNLETDLATDPRKEKDRAKLIALFCERCNIKMGFKPDASQADLWT